MSVTEQLHRERRENWRDFLENHYGMASLEHQDFQKILIRQMGDLPRTTDELYGERLHRYTIQNAIHDNAVLGFQVEHNGPKTMSDETDSKLYDNEAHMLKVLDVILNKSYHKLGFQNGKGQDV